ncbi:major facilitator superfamily domain-containing protein [Circinella umbellata]|nr:major facilitator superfamily domain-containing protein [Circinella umbellata]
MSNKKDNIISDNVSDTNGEKQEQTAAISLPTLIDLDSQEQKSDIDKTKLRQLLFKLDIRILPLFALCQMFSFMDRVNIGNAKIAGLVETTDITEDGYNTALSIFFVGYILLELPSNVVLNKLGPRLWISILMILCGCVMMIMSIAKNDTSLIFIRLFLGFTEAGLFPALIFSMSVWYTKTQLTKRIAIVLIHTSAASVVGGLMAYGIMLHLEGAGSLHGWQWIFLVEGGLTVLIGIIVYIFLPEFPEKFFNEHEYDIFIEHKNNSFALYSVFEGDAMYKKIPWESIFVAIKDWYVLIFGLANLCFLTIKFNNALFFPSIIKGFGFTPLNAQLLTIPPHFIACVCSLVVAFSADHNKERGYHILSSSLFTAFGFALLIGLKDSETAPLYVALIFVSVGSQCCGPCIGSWYSSNFAGRAKRSAATGLISMYSNLGGIISGQLYRQSDAPQYVHGHSASLAIVFCGIILSGVLKIIFKRENIKRDKMTVEERHEVLANNNPNKLGDKHPDFRYLL